MSASYDLALHLRAAGISAIPVLLDGTKTPARPWKEFQSRLPYVRELENWFVKHEFGVGAIGGEVSGNLEIIDFDVLDSLALWEEAVEDLAPGLVARLVRIQTPRPGLQFWYRCEEPVAGNTKLARRQVGTKPDGTDDVTCMIETRGEGGYAVAPGGPLEVHKTSRPYEVLHGDPTKLAVISTEERKVLLDCARALNEYVDPERSKDVQTQFRVSGSGNGNRPGDDYNRRGDVEGLLVKHGWTVARRRGEIIDLRRPGKDRGLSATLHAVGVNCFYVFSTNAAPFAIERKYDAVGVLARLEHGGDIVAAVRALGAQGYGEPPRARSERPPAPGDDDVPPQADKAVPASQLVPVPEFEPDVDEGPDPDVPREPEAIFKELEEAEEDEARIPLLRELAAVVSEDPFMVHNWGAKVAKAGWSTKGAFEESANTVNRKRKRRGAASQSATWSGDGENPGPKTAGAMLKDSPNPNLIIPEPYYVRENVTGLYVRGEDEEPIPRAIACAPILITGRLNQVTNGPEGLSLCWREGYKWREKIVDRGQAMDARKLVELANDGFPVASDNARDLVAYLRRFEAANLLHLPVAHVSGSMGWQGPARRDGFLWGSAHIQPTGEIVRCPQLCDSTRQWRDDVIAFRATSVGDEQIVAGYHSQGTREEWEEAVRPAMAHPRARLALYASVATPLLAILGCPNFIIDFAHPTSVGKTTLLRIAASVWGDPTLESPTAAMWTWDVTRVFIERASAVIGGLPLILDDTKRARKTEMISDLIYTVASGRGRGRGSVQGIAETAIWSTILMSSGEEPATSYTKEGGAKTRVLEITGMPFGATTPALRKMVEDVNRGIWFHYGHIGPDFVQWLVRNRAREEQFVSLYRKRLEIYAGLTQIPEAGRLAQYAAAVYVAGVLLHEALSLSWGFEDPFVTLWETTAEEARNASGYAQALQLVESWCYSNRERFIGQSTLTPTQGWLGRWDAGETDQWIGIFPDKLREMLMRAGYNNVDGYLRGWRDNDWIKTDTGRKRYTKRTRLPAADGQGPLVNLVVIPVAAFQCAQEGGTGCEQDQI